MDDDDEIAYYTSQAAYGSDDYEKKLAEKGYHPDSEFSTHRSKVYSKKGGKTFLAYKGTDPTNLTDLDADAAIALGTHRRHKEFREASDLAHRVKSKYGESVVATGHSLGGTKAIESANDIGVKAIVFNPGTGLAGLDTGEHRVYIKDQDIISSRVKGSNVRKSRGGHSLSGFEDQFKPKSVVDKASERKRRGAETSFLHNIVSHGVLRGVSKRVRRFGV